ncbi:MAG: hypothetical protein GX981_04795 [Tissierellia bacterium]|nr:hypothetical protein [Tissierellia bacterium]
MKRTILIILSLTIFLLTGCHRFGVEIEEKIERDRKEVVAKIEGGSVEEAGKKILKWGIQSEDVNLSLKGVNNYLNSLGKDYNIVFVPYKSNSRIKIGKNYYEFLEKEIANGQLDIINFGVKNKAIIEYMNLLSQGDDMLGYREDELAISQLIENNYIMEIDPSYSIDKSTLIDGKCFGFGNYSFKGPIGFVWFSDIVKDKEAKELKPNPWDNMELLIKYKENFNSSPIMLMHDYSSFIEGYSIYLDLLVADPKSGQVQYVFDTQEYKKLAKGIKTLRENKLLVDPFNLQKMDQSINPSVVSAFLLDTEVIEKIDPNIYKVKYEEKEGFFVTYSYPYQIRNYMQLENGISKNSKYQEEALDFLNLMYTDSNIVNIFQKDNTGKDIKRYCNEWLLPDQVKIMEEYEELEAYLNRYKIDKLEGFHFNDIVDEIQSTINITLGNIVKKDKETIIFIDEFNSYQFMDENYEKNIERLRQLLKNSGVDISKKYFQEKINKFLKAQYDIR